MLYSNLINLIVSIIWNSWCCMQSVSHHYQHITHMVTDLPCICWCCQCQWQHQHVQGKAVIMCWCYFGIQQGDHLSPLISLYDMRCPTSSIWSFPTTASSSSALHPHHLRILLICHPPGRCDMNYSSAESGWGRREGPGLLAGLTTAGQQLGSLQLIVINVCRYAI